MKDKGELMQVTIPWLCNFTIFALKYFCISQFRNVRSRSKDNSWVSNLTSCFYLSSLWSSLSTRGISIWSTGLTPTFIVSSIPAEQYGSSGTGLGPTPAASPRAWICPCHAAMSTEQHHEALYWGTYPPLRSSLRDPCTTLHCAWEHSCSLYGSGELLAS